MLDSKQTLYSTGTVSQLEAALKKLESLYASYDYLKITLASPKRIRSWAQKILPTGRIVGEVSSADTLNYKDYKPELGGLFCPIIFGPTEDWKCRCGKYNGFLINKVCEKCFVELIESRVRRYRMGYIELANPVVHLWYLRGLPNYLRLLLRSFDEREDLFITQIDAGKLEQRHLELLVYYRDAWVPPSLRKFAVSEKKEISEDEFDDFRLYEQALNTDFQVFSEGSKYFKVKKSHGTEIIKTALENLDLNLKNQIKKDRSLITGLTYRLTDKFYNIEKILDYKTSGVDRSIVKRIRILESFVLTKTNPSWMMLTTLPILPPTLRPLLELENELLVSSDLNELYRLIIYRNANLWRALKAGEDMMYSQGRQILQEAVDCLIDNSRVPAERQQTLKTSLNDKPLVALTEILEGKEGRFRQTLLGKRVDYSGRSVIVVGPQLRLNQCGLPYEMGAELFRPFLVNALFKTVLQNSNQNVKLAHKMIKENEPFVVRLMIQLSQKYSILLNRAPTLHRFGIQAFDPVIILGQAIQLHPLVCTGFNADFDGDQMAVHLPLYDESQLEVKMMMRPSSNVLSPSNGEVILKPSQDMVIGCYYLTMMVHQQKQWIQRWFGSENHALSAFYQKKLNIHSNVLVRYSLKSFKIKVEMGKIKFFETVTGLSTNDKEISISKIYQLGDLYKKYFLITNIGVFIAHTKTKNEYELTDLFLETTPGRLIFSINFKNAIKV